MLNTRIWDDRYIPEFDRETRLFIPEYVRSRLSRDRYLVRREVNRDKDPFQTELEVFETGENFLS